MYVYFICKSNDSGRNIHSYAFIRFILNAQIQWYFVAGLMLVQHFVFLFFFFLAHWLRCLRVLANIATFLFYIFCCNIALDCLKITSCTEYFFKFFYAILFGFYTSWLYVALLPPVVPTYWSMCVFLCIVFSTFLHWSRCCLYRFEKSRNEMRSTI